MSNDQGGDGARHTLDYGRPAPRQRASRLALFSFACSIVGFPAVNMPIGKWLFDSSLVPSRGPLRLFLIFAVIIGPATVAILSGAAAIFMSFRYHRDLKGRRLSILAIAISSVSLVIFWILHRVLDVPGTT